MRFRGLALFPLIFAAAFVAVAFALAGTEALSTFVTAQKLLVRGIALAGCVAAIRVFSPGDQLRRAWFWLFVSTALVLARDLIRLLPGELGSGELTRWVGSGLAIVSNVTLLAGVVLLVRVWRAASFGSEHRGRAIAITVAVALVAIAVAGRTAVQNAGAAFGGNPDAMLAVFSSVIDILCLCLVGPLLVAALELRGGTFFWPWALITASLAGWIAYDAAVWIEASGWGGGFPLRDLFRGLAQNYQAVAGFAQAWVIHEVRRRAAG